MVSESFYKQPTLPDFSSEEVTSVPLPPKIGPYKIESLLNKGGMSLLYLGIDPETKQLVVIKVLSPKYVTHPEAIERFLKEAQIIALSNHPNIVKLYGHGEWEGGLYIAMEFIRGISLRQFILQQSLSLRRCLDVTLQVAYALSHFHAHGIIHRDLKPENILITEDGEVKVIDFGIAQLHEEDTGKSFQESKGIMGTPSYMSPEQKEDPHNVTFASDIYSLGIIMYELVLGKLSYGVINISLIPKGLRKIIDKALAISPRERYQDIVDFITDISKYLKSGEWEKDRPGSDQFKEIIETLQIAQQDLSPLLPPPWPPVNIGLSKYRAPGQLSLYYDFFKLADNSFVVLIVQAAASGVEGSIYSAALRGMAHALLFPYTLSVKESFRPSVFLNTMNQMITMDGMKQQFSLSFLLLDPLRDQLAFASCGMGALLHLPQGSTKPRRLLSQNSPLGAKAVGEFLITVDNWNVGDTLLLNSFDAKSDAELESPMQQAFAESSLLSAQRQAEAILKKIATAPNFPAQKYSQAFITLQRII